MPKFLVIRSHLAVVEDPKNYPSGKKTGYPHIYKPGTIYEFDENPNENIFAELTEDGGFVDYKKVQDVRRFGPECLKVDSPGQNIK